MIFAGGGGCGDGCLLSRFHSYREMAAAMASSHGSAVGGNPVVRLAH